MFDEQIGVFPRGVKRSDSGERRRGVAVNDGFQHIDKDFGVGHAEKIQHLFSGDGFAALADINDLIEKAQGVAHGMIASGGDKA